tara:strand:+ start:301 stop:1314 length:1014 start_codon:yes stop_codon:yes gene_type:complete
MNYICEYIWIGGNGELHSKAKTLISNSTSISLIDFPDWNYDGSSTNQADTDNSEIILKPISFYPCPFRKGKNYLVMCDIYNINNKPIGTRYAANILFNCDLQQKPWFGIEQEYFIMNKNNKPYDYELNRNSKQGQFYCSVGTGNAMCRQLVEKHYEHCLYSGLQISGVNSEVAPSQWEYQIGPVEGINAADQLYVSRYILLRLSEEYNVIINFEPKPLESPFNGSGCHVNFSTENIRQGTDCIKGIDLIIEYINKLKNNHSLHMENYGKNNHLRMNGLCETSDYDNFSYGTSNRSASVRIPSTVSKEGKGYFEDRRPSSNMDPYLVTSLIFKTCCLN